MTEAVDVDALHDPWQLPFELVDVTPHLEEPQWAVALDDGNVLFQRGRFSYAIAARVEGHEHVLTTEDSVREAAADYLAQQSEQQSCWLLRFERSSGSTLQTVVLRDAEAVAARKRVDRQVALLMDFGKVLCDFDYRLFSWAHEAVFGHQPSPAELLEIEQARPAFEAGDIPEDDFCTFAMEKLGLIPADRKLFHAAWSNILKIEDGMRALLERALARPGWTGVIVSNIDPILIRECVPRFGLQDIFRDGVYSYQEDVRPKQEDASMWRLARARCLERLGAEPALTVATDDTPANLLTAAAEPGINGTIQFHNPWQWQYALGRLGAYLPRQK